MKRANAPWTGAGCVSLSRRAPQARAWSPAYPSATVVGRLDPACDPLPGPREAWLALSESRSGCTAWRGPCHKGALPLVTYTSDKSEGPTAGRHSFAAVALIARLVAHIPDRGQVLQRYYGYYANLKAA